MNLYKQNDSFQVAELTQKVICLLLIIVVMVIRKPELLIDPRFFQEEGSIYFPHAFNHGFVDNLFMQYGGYYALITNLAASIAAMFPLAVAPLITTYLAFIGTLVPCATVLFGNIPFLDTVPKKMLMALAINLFSFGGSWLTTIHTQYYLALTTFFILLENGQHSSTLKKFTYRAVLIFSGLSGVLACFLVPAFFFKWLRSRSKEDLVQCSLLSITGLIQITILLACIINSDSFITSHRMNKPGLELPLSMILFQFVYPFLGLAMFKLSGTVQMFVGLIILLYFTLELCRDMKDPQKLPLILSFLFVFILSSLLSVDIVYVPRYAYFPTVVMFLYLLTKSEGDTGKIKKFIPKLLLITMVMFNSLGYRSQADNFYSENWPKWRDEVVIWEKDHNYHIRIWPLHNNVRWEMQLFDNK